MSEISKPSKKRRSGKRRSARRPSAMSIPITDPRVEEIPRRQYMSIPTPNPIGQQPRHRGSRRKEQNINRQYDTLFHQMHADHRRMNPITVRQQSAEQTKTAELRRSIAERLHTVDEGALAIISEMLSGDPSSFNVSKMIGSRHYRSSSDGKTYLNGLLHSFDDQPAEVKSWMGQLEQYWYKNGKLHRDNGPAYIVKNQYGNVTLEQIWKNGKMISSQVHPGHYYGEDDDYYQSDGGDY